MSKPSESAFSHHFLTGRDMSILVTKTKIIFITKISLQTSSSPSSFSSSGLEPEFRVHFGVHSAVTLLFIVVTAEVIVTVIHVLTIQFVDYDKIACKLIVKFMLNEFTVHIC